MFKKLAILLTIALFILPLEGYVSAELAVGVKKGDWIEYNVTYTGTPSLGHDVNWAHLEVTDVEEKRISVSIITKFPDGRTEVFNTTINLQTGYLIDDFIIPANLTTGDHFYDQKIGNITIERTQEQIYAGATRAVLYASTATSTYIWDKTTGVSVEGDSQEPTYTIHTIVANTNMWKPSSQNGGDTAIFVAVIVCLVVLFAALAVRYRGKFNCH